MQKYEEAIGEIESSRTKFISQLGKVKSWILQLELIFDVGEGHSLIRKTLDHKNEDDAYYTKLNDRLDEAMDAYFHEHSHERDHETACHQDVLYTRFLYYQAKCLFKIERYSESRILVSQSMTFSRELQQTKYFNKTYSLFGEVSNKLKIQINNLFVFAKSSPIRERSEATEIIVKQLQDNP